MNLKMAPTLQRIRSPAWRALIACLVLTQVSTAPAQGTQQYGHDPGNRLIRSVQADGALQTYVYDAAGNLTAIRREGNPQWIVNPANGHRYALLRCTEWLSCEATAVLLGGHLATVRNDAENDWLQSTFALANVASGYWIGLHDRRQEGVFEWVSGERLAYHHFRTGEPNNNCAGQPENSVHIWGHAVETGTWNDAPGEFNACWTSPAISGALAEIVPATRQLQVPAALETGTPLKNPYGRPSVCSFVATGHWFAGPASPPEGISPDGLNEAAPGSFRLPGGHPFELSAVRGDGSVISLGLQSQWTLDAAETVHLIMNDAVGAYGDNTGEINLRWMCQ